MIVIYGEPRGKQRPRFTRVADYIRTYTPKETKDYEFCIKEEYNKQCGKYFEPDIPLRAVIYAYFKIPTAFSKKKVEMAENDLIRPMIKCDADNIAKVILDALNGVAYYDDKFIADLRVIKKYSKTPRVEFEIEELKL